MKKVALIISAYNEENNIKVMYDSLKENTLDLNYDFNICFVDDGSTDTSYEIIKSLSNTDKKVKILKFIHNFGHEEAMIGGIDYFTGYDYYILLDCDTQHPPKYIKNILESLDDGHDAVFMRREDNDSRSAITNFLSSAYYDLFNLLFRGRVIKSVSDFLALNENLAVEVRNKYRYKNRLLRYILQTIAKNPAVIDYIPVKRYSGESKYPFRKYFLLALSSVHCMLLLNKKSNLADLHYEIDTSKSIN